MVFAFVRNSFGLARSAAALLIMVGLPPPLCTRWTALYGVQYTLAGHSSTYEKFSLNHQSAAAVRGFA